MLVENRVLYISEQNPQVCLKLLHGYLLFSTLDGVSFHGQRELDGAHYRIIASTLNVLERFSSVQLSQPVTFNQRV